MKVIQYTHKIMTNIRMTDFRKTCNSMCGQGQRCMEEYFQERKKTC